MKTTIILSKVAAVLLISVQASWACPFCSVESQTLSEEMQSADATVVASLVREAELPSDTEADFGEADADSGTATFKIAEVLRGEGIAPGDEIEVVFFGKPDREQLFLINGLAGEKLDWTTPLPLSGPAVDYVRQLQSVAPSGADRLAFFQEYLEHEDPLLAQDAYDEFARAPYEEVKELGPRMHHGRLVKWIVDPEVSPSRRGLYYTMLGICGNDRDVPLLESLIVSDIAELKPLLERAASCGLAVGGPLALPTWPQVVEQHERQKKLGLNALVACYLVLRGPEGLDIIDQRFLKNPRAEYTHIYSTIMALRFHGDERTDVIPRDRLLSSMRLLLDNPDFADQVILDLARWEDWSVLDRVVEMFKTTDDAGYVKQPIVSYLTVASEQPGDVGSRATKALAELERLDPDTVKQARSLMAFGVLGRARAAANGSGATQPADATQGLAATPGDSGANTDDMPDPASYEEDKSSVIAAAATSTAEATPAATETSKGETAQVPTERNSPKPETGQPAAKDAVSPTATKIASPGVLVGEINRPVVIGVPLVAAVALMGVYWLILRSGAV